MATNLNKDAVVGKTFLELDPAATFNAVDGVLVFQDGVFRRGTITQFQDGFLTEGELDEHITATNPHGVTAPQVGAFTTQQSTSAINSAVAAHSAIKNPHGLSAGDINALTSAQVSSTIAGALNNTTLTGAPTADTPPPTSSGTRLATTRFVTDVLRTVYPVGSVYINLAVATNPSTLLGFGTWTRAGEGKMLVGLSAGETEFNTLGKTGGAKRVSISTAQLPTHAHGVTDNGHAHPLNNNVRVGFIGNADRSKTGAEVLLGGTGQPIATSLVGSGIGIQNTGSGESHENLPPYLTAYMWQRTA